VSAYFDSVCIAKCYLCAAGEAGFTEVWTNDRHMLGAAPAFGLRGRSV
jgi:hypothetical protein